jgi:hypothetical protein
MKERFKELAEQAGLYDFVYEAMGIDEEMQKFAELIVQECISALEEKIYRSIDSDGDEVWADLILKEHFGIGEM